MSKETGGPVFPTLEAHGFNSGMPGMEMRDYFAAKAMQSFWSEEDLHPSVTKQDAAEWAYGMADAMLAERAK